MIVVSDNSNMNDIEISEVVASRVRLLTLIGREGGADETHEQNVRVAGDTADVETGQLLSIKR